MRLVRTDAEKYKQGKASEMADVVDADEDSSYRHRPEAKLENNFYADLLLPRRSLYIMSHTARYNFTHEILGNEHSKFLDQTIEKTRRISIICRNDPWTEFYFKLICWYFQVVLYVNYKLIFRNVLIVTLLDSRTIHEF